MSYQPQKVAGISVYELDSLQEAYQFAYTLLRDEINKKTLLLLSGGDNAIQLYELLSKFATIAPGAAAMLDEVFGLPFHYKSHELKVQDANLIDHFSKKGVPFYRILSRSASSLGTARLYENHLAQLLADHPKKVAVLELHKDASLAALFPYRDNWSNSAFKAEGLVTAFEDQKLPEDMQERITATFEALEKVDVFVVLAIGEDKRRALKKLFSSDKRQITRVPATFLQNRRGVEVHLVTDQRVG